MHETLDILSPERALKCLINIEASSEGDIELQHRRADALLLTILSSLGYEKLVDRFDDLEKYYV